MACQEQIDRGRGQGRAPTPTPTLKVTGAEGTGSQLQPLSPCITYDLVPAFQPSLASYIHRLCRVSYSYSHGTYRLTRFLEKSGGQQCGGSRSRYAYVRYYKSGVHYVKPRSASTRHAHLVMPSFFLLVSSMHCHEPTTTTSRHAASHVAPACTFVRS